MIRLPLLVAAGAVAVAAAVTPAVAGLTGNPSFSERLPVHVPAHANAPTFPSRPVTSAPRSREREPGDDGHHGRGRG